MYVALKLLGGGGGEETKSARKHKQLMRFRLPFPTAPLRATLHIILKVSPMLQSQFYLGARVEVVLWEGGKLPKLEEPQ